MGDGVVGSRVGSVHGSLAAFFFFAGTGASAETLTTLCVLAARLLTARTVLRVCTLLTTPNAILSQPLLNRKNKALHDKHKPDRRRQPLCLFLPSS
mmetsp:Transcript_34299/g.74283  ORF Transcript_34299/g.74283 Transcript_34299/m.74283 type:complete len:96 (-) Transcript_34299:21-308(-)